MARARAPPTSDDEGVEEFVLLSSIMVISAMRSTVFMSDSLIEIGIAIVLPGVGIAEGNEESNVDIFL